MIEVSSIYKSFDEQIVLNNISAIFEDGKTNLIIGKSGAGKTVLLKCIVGLTTPEKGKIAYDGRNITTFNKKEMMLLRREIGMLFQNSALFDSMSVLENVMFPLDMFSDMTYNDRVKRAQFCLDRVNLLEALALAGDLNITGRRDNVLLVRINSDGSRTTARIDLNDKELIMSPFFYLQQNDIIYVEPNQSKAASAYSVPPAASIAISATSVALSAASLILTILTYSK